MSWACMGIMEGGGWEHYTGGGDCTTCYIFYPHVSGDIYSPSRPQGGPFIQEGLEGGSAHPGQRTGAAASGQ
jgi:hypothetical protein